MLPLGMFELRQYVEGDGHNPFERWFDSLDLHARLKVTTALARMENGNLGDVKSVGQGVSETRVHHTMPLAIESITPGMASG